LQPSLLRKDFDHIEQKVKERVLMKKLDFAINRCTLDLTEKCNLRCKYCFTYGVGRRDIDYKQAVKTIDWIFQDEVCQSNEVQLDWWGGEPILKFDLMKRLTEYAVQKAAKEKKRIMIGGTSNVTLWDKDVVDWMNQTKAYFMMSIDGIREVQDKYRPTRMKESSFDMIIKRLPYIIEKIPFIRSRMAPTPDTIGKMLESIKFYHKMGINSQMFSPVYEMDWTDAYLDEAEFVLKSIVDYMIEVKLQGKNIEIKHFDDGARNLHMKKSRPEMPCGAGRFYVGVSVDGIIYPCHRFNKYDGRDWKKKEYIGTIDEGITRPEFREKFIHFLDIPQPKCKDCKWYGNLCDVSCYAINFDLTGNVAIPPDVACRWMERQGRAIHYYYEQLLKNKLPVPGINMNAGMNMNQPGGRKMTGSCICNNMCYLEGTEHETKVVDRNNDFACHCYSTSYNGGLNDQARALTAEEINAGGPPKEDRVSLAKNLTTAVEKLNSSVDQLVDVIKELKADLKKEK
jgi:uncharacterized protein